MTLVLTVNKFIFETTNHMSKYKQHSLIITGQDINRMHIGELFCRKLDIEIPRAHPNNFKLL